jgi:hypothetical protein
MYGEISKGMADPVKTRLRALRPAGRPLGVARGADARVLPVANLAVLAVRGMRNSSLNCPSVSGIIYTTATDTSGPFGPWFGERGK